MRQTDRKEGIEKINTPDCSYYLHIFFKSRLANNLIFSGCYNPKTNSRVEAVKYYENMLMESSK